jgi:thiamine biosynthesis lipoprotein
MISAAITKTASNGWEQGLFCAPRFHVGFCHYLSLVTSLFATFLLAACGGSSGENPAVSFSGATMGTSYSVKVAHVPRDVEADQLKINVDAVLRQVNDSMSTYDGSSELSRFNQSRSTDWVSVSNQLLTVVREALRVSHLSAGAFDVTVGPVVNLWGFGPSPGRGEIPSDAQIQAAVAKVGYNRLRVRYAPPAIRKDDPDLYVDLSAIAKGYGVDQVAAYLESREIQNYLVEVGGELRAKGNKAAGIPWRIGIEKPTPAERTVEEIIDIPEGAVATSGDYRNFFEVGNERFTHEIDPRTGRPVTHNLASVTVISPSAMQADAMATALMILGPEAGFQLAERENLAAFFLVKQGKGFDERSTTAFQEYLPQ